jgi:integration host factor subunit alpha
MGALTKAEMAERLYEELGLNKREAKELVELFFEEIRHALKTTNRSNCPVSAILTFGTNASGLAAIRKREKKSRSRLAVWSPFVQGRS